MWGVKFKSPLFHGPLPACVEYIIKRLRYVGDAPRSDPTDVPAAKLTTGSDFSEAIHPSDASGEHSGDVFSVGSWFQDARLPFSRRISITREQGKMLRASSRLPVTVSWWVGDEGTCSLWSHTTHTSETQPCSIRVHKQFLSRVIICTGYSLCRKIPAERVGAEERGPGPQGETN